MVPSFLVPSRWGAACRVLCCGVAWGFLLAQSAYGQFVLSGSSPDPSGGSWTGTAGDGGISDSGSERLGAASGQPCSVQGPFTWTWQWTGPNPAPQYAMLTVVAEAGWGGEGRGCKRRNGRPGGRWRPAARSAIGGHLRGHALCSRDHRSGRHRDVSGRPVGLRSRRRLLMPGDRHNCTGHDHVDGTGSGQSNLQPRRRPAHDRLGELRGGFCIRYVHVGHAG